MWLILPLKDFVKAKQRLSGCLSISERRALFQHMVEDVLAQLSAVDEVDQLLIVSDDPAAHLLAEHFHALCWPESQLGSGLNAVLEATLDRISSLDKPPQHVMIVHGDLPLLSAAELRDLIAVQGWASEQVVIATDRHGGGSNVVLMPLASRIRLRYGEGSLTAHTAEAAARNLSLQVFHAPGLANDIDTREDLLALVSAGTSSRAPQTMRYLSESGIARRLLQMNPRECAAVEPPRVVRS
jgi:2-phospho-L-lactate guanylyltransferase